MHRPVVSLLMPVALSACASPSPGDQPAAGNTFNLPTLTGLWSLPEITGGGYSTLLGDVYLGRSKLQLTAVDIRSRKVAFSSPLYIDRLRTNVAAFGNYYVSMTGQDKNTLTILDKTGRTLNTVNLPGGTSQNLFQVGPHVTPTSLYVVSGPKLFKFNTADLLKPAAAPVWIRTYPGLGLNSLVVQDDDHLFVSVNADTARPLVALNGQGEQRWSVEVAPLDLPLASASILGLYRDTVIAQAGPAGLQAYRISTGEKAWAAFPSIDVCPGGRAQNSFNLTIAADKIFMGPFGGTCVVAVHADTGTLAWVFESPNRYTFDTAPLYVNGVVYATNSRLWAIDAETGKGLAVSAEDLEQNIGAPLAYDPVEHQVLQWGSTGIYAFKPVK